MSTIEITYDGTDISDHVLYSSASFESQLGAQPGQFSITVKDPDRTLSFGTGKEIKLYIDGVLYYGGFVLQVTKQFAVPVDDTTQGVSHVRTRQWLLQGSDYNILLDRRFLYNKASPISIVPPLTGNPTDYTVIRTMCDNYLDATDVDTSTHVVAVTTGDVMTSGTGQYGYQGGVGTSWRHQMIWASQFSGAIWYIDANKALWYFDRESTTPSWAFSDNPDRVSTFGFRDFQFIEDATNLANDALVWGGSEAGVTGTSGQLVFGRATDSTSISNFFRSQFAETKFGDITSNTGCQTIANVVVFGDPGGAGGGLEDTNRGLENPQQYIRLTWFDQGVPTRLIPGTVVTTYLTVFGESYTLPVRNIKVSFDSPSIVRFEGYFGVQTDDPFTLWKYMKKVTDAGGTAAQSTSLLVPSSDGSTTATVAGTEVSMVPVHVSGTTYQVTDPYAPNSLEVWLNGLLQRHGIDYAETDASAGTFDFADQPLGGDNLWVRYISA